jgi:hypothetical protein
MRCCASFAVFSHSVKNPIKISEEFGVFSFIFFLFFFDLQELLGSPADVLLVGLKTGFFAYCWTGLSSAD